MEDLNEHKNEIKDNLQVKNEDMDPTHLELVLRSFHEVRVAKAKIKVQGEENVIR